MAEEAAAAAAASVVLTIVVVVAEVQVRAAKSMRILFSFMTFA